MPGTRRIFAGVSGSPDSVHALRQAAQLAHHHDALLIPVLAVLPPPWPGRQATACAAGRSGTAGPAQQPSPPREPATLPTGPSRAAGERTHRRLAKPTRREMVMSKHRAADTVARRGRSPDSGRWAPWRHARPPAPCATQRSPGRLA
jgi:hypothetical protein